MKTIEELKSELETHKSKIQEIQKRFDIVAIQKKNSVAIAEDIFVEYVIQKIKGVKFKMFSNPSCDCILQCSFKSRRDYGKLFTQQAVIEDFYDYHECFSPHGHGFSDSDFAFTYIKNNPRREKIEGKWVDVPPQPFDRIPLIEGNFKWDDSYLYIKKPHRMSIKDFIDWTKSIGIIIENKDFQSQKERLNKQIEDLKASLLSLQIEENEFKEKTS